MKKLLVSMLLCLLLALPAVAQKKSDREIDGLKGLVKSIRVETAHYEQQSGEWVNKRTEIVSTEYGLDGRLVQHAARTPDGALTNRYSYAYNDAGKLIERKRYSFGDNLTETRRYEYSPKGELMAETDYKSDGSTTASETYKYDDNGREIEQISKASGFRFVSRYDEKGQLLEKIISRSNEPDRKVVYSYNEAGKLTSLTRYKLIQPNPVVEEVRNYDAGGNVVERTYYDTSGAVILKEVKSYNADGKAIEEAGYGKDGALQSKTSTAFEYDPQGNWTKQTKTPALPDSKSLWKEVTTRTITYENGIGPGPGPHEINPAARVDTKPIPLNQPTPEYTALARSNGVEGTVRVRVLIGPDGLVKQVRLVRGLPDGLEAAAIRAAYKLKFKPATINGQPTFFWAPVDVEFRLKR